MSLEKKESSLSDKVQQALKHLLQSDSWLEPYREIIQRRLLKIAEAERELTQGKMSLADFASGHEYFGLHFARPPVDFSRVGTQRDGDISDRRYDGLAGKGCVCLKSA